MNRRDQIAMTAEEQSAYLASARTNKEPVDRYKALAETRPVEKLPPPLPRPTAPEPLADEVRHSIRCTVRLPDPEKGDPGQIIEGSYSLSDSVLRVYDETGRLLGTDTLRPGDDAGHAARKILKESGAKADIS